MWGLRVRFLGYEIQERMNLCKEAHLRKAIPVTRNRTRDHLISARVYSQMLCQLSYDRMKTRRDILNICCAYMSHMLAARLLARRKQGISGARAGKKNGGAHNNNRAETEQWRPNAKNDDTPKIRTLNPSCFKILKNKILAA